MSDEFYSEPELYDLMFTPGEHAPFYAGAARRAGGPVLELACGTGQLLEPIARGGQPVVGLDLAAPMLDVARERLRGAPAELVEGDMRHFDLARSFGMVFIARNSLLHLHATDDLLACLRSVRRHLEPDGVFVLDVFNPSVQLLARPAGKRFRMMEVRHPTRGEVTVEAESAYDAATQVTRGTWYFSAPGAPDFWTAPLEVRSIFPQELPLLLAAGGFRLESRHGDLSGAPFHGGSPRQICLCRPE